ncbi:helix-turn-helix domain-containing protein [Kineosporia sp. J2-2]|uniref:Helix-turn-helix domain-containing protein n=1 Tax=Kineosporia corallincola TaxID=2835133 RepID=A0ABS5TT79_9ACTN|nr:ArsR family transcriptional regulator [Kineosporia corallincola]MBT0773993.1 helix-turn-helix domain-containing protein [Kineosporia corallincola]
MIRIHLDEITRARTRITISPLLEMIRSLELLHRHPVAVPWPYTDWADRAREVLRTQPGTAPLRLYGDLYGKDHGRPTPDVFTPLPEQALPDLETELGLLRRTEPAVMREQFGKHYPEGIPAFLQVYEREPEAAFARLADAFATYWQLAVEPYWPAMRTALDEEVLRRARALATEGADALLLDLHGPQVWQAPVLSFPRHRKESTLVAVDQRLLLIPLIFAGNTSMVSTDHPHIQSISYQAPGQALLAARPPSSSPPDRLTVLLGPARSAVLLALRRPSSTTGLAQELKLAPSTVSEHLAGLLAAGLVRRRRSGRRVLYELEPAGAALLSLLGSPTQDGGFG